MIKTGRKAPNLILKTVDGGNIALADTWSKGQHVVLVFLRHLG